MAEGIDREDNLNHFRAFASIIREFIKALWKSHTYNIGKNGYLIFGILWGIPVPVVTIGMGLYYKELSPTLHNILAELIANPMHFFFLMHPILFGIVFGAMGTVRDDKERQRLKFEESLIEINKKLEESNKRLKELDELKDNFLSMVSHELWTPLTTVQGYVSFIREEKAGDLALKQRELLGIVEAEVEHLNYLIGELVDVSKIEAGKLEVQLDCLDIRDVEARVIDSLRQKIEEKRIIIKNALPSELPYALADEKRITQVLTNLLGNAIKFTPMHGTISIAAEIKDEKIEISIRDTGIGIPPDKLGRIFDRFYQVDSTNNREYGGCGLGLTIAKSIIELHGGRIWVDSEEGKGSEFSFELEKWKEEDGKCDI